MVELRVRWLLGFLAAGGILGFDGPVQAAGDEAAGDETAGEGFRVQWPQRRLWVGAEGVEGITVHAVGPQGRLDAGYTGTVAISGLGSQAFLILNDGQATVPPATISSDQVIVHAEGRKTRAKVPILPGIWSLLPATIAIVLALATRQVILSLLGGIFVGVALSGRSFFQGFAGTLDTMVAVLLDPDKLKIVTFTMTMGGLVGLVSRSGGTVGVVQAIARRAKNARSGSVATWMMGMVIFFDDYASSLLIGTTMRPITDRLRISREKLAYLVDSTAAPIASLALISTWIGYEVSVLGDALDASGISRDPYEVFLSGLGSRFYQGFALVFVLMVGLMGRDFGPMYTAERRARKEGKLLRDGASPLMDAGLLDDATKLRTVTPRVWLAVVPIAVLIGVVLWVLGSTGSEAARFAPAAFEEASTRGLIGQLGFILANAASYDALVYGGSAACAVAAVTAVATGTLSLAHTIEGFLDGLKAMLLAVVVLVLAWSVGKVMNDLEAGLYVADIVGAHLPAWSLSTIAFVLAAILAFSTGTSWGTMAVLFPVLVPVIALHAATPGFEPVLLGTTSAVLAGAVFGDHCSPISDTTVLSSIASASDHVDHTRTQAPYALLCGGVSIGIGYLPYAFGVPLIITWVLGLTCLGGALWFIGRNPDEV